MMALARGVFPAGAAYGALSRCGMMTVAGPVGWRAGAALNLPDRAWRGGADPGTGGVFVITYNEERIWDCKADGGFPDAKTLEQRAPQQSGPRCRSHRPRGRRERAEVRS